MLTILQNYIDCRQSTQLECRNQPSQLGSPEKLAGAHDPQHALHENGGLADLWYVDEGDIMCHPILVPSCLQEFDVASAMVGAERNPRKTDVIYHVNDLDTALLERTIHDVQNMAKVFWLLPREYVWELATSTTSCEYTSTQSFRNGLQKSTTRLGSGLSNEDSMRQATLSAGQSGIGCKRARDIAAPAHLRALIAAKPRIQAVIQDAVWAGLLPEHLLETRLAAVIGTATSTCLSALDDEDQATAKLYVQKAAQAANNWRTAGTKCRKPTITSLEHPGSASEDEHSDDMDFSAPRKSWLTAPQLQAQLSRPTDWTRTLLSKGSLQQKTRIEDLCHTLVSHKWLNHLDACVECPDAARQHYQRAKRTRQQTLRGWWAVSINMQKPAAQPEPREDTMRAFTLWSAA